MTKLFSEEERNKAFQKIGFWESDLKITDEKKRINLSCGQCRQTFKGNDCEIIESEIENSHRFTKKIELHCPECESVLVGGCI